MGCARVEECHERGIKGCALFYPCKFIIAAFGKQEEPEEVSENTRLIVKQAERQFMESTA